MRTFNTGATRDTLSNKPSYRGFLSATVIRTFGQYMLSKQIQPDGTLRDPDNWKKGMPQEVYLDSLMRHVVDLWLHHEDRSELAKEDITDTLCAIFFNIQGYLHEHLKNLDAQNLLDLQEEDLPF
jgi:hypothetical protein